MRLSAALRLSGVSLAAIVPLLAGCHADDKPPGGTLVVLQQDDPDSIDAGQTYGTTGYEIAFATQRPLYSFRPDDPSNPLPDLAAAAPRVAADGKTVTVHIRRGVRFSPPVNREVTAADVRYAIERGFLPTVANPYVSLYFGDLRGLARFEKRRSGHIAGIETPDRSTLIVKLTRPSGRLVAGALGLPVTAPVPREYAARFDRRNPSAYAMHQVATGPYMIANDRAGKVTGFTPHRRIVLVRNPNWDRKLDPRPAALDRVEIRSGVDPQVGARQILAGRGQVSGDFAPPPAQLRRATQLRQVRAVPDGGVDFVALNTRIAPFDDPDVRKAVLAAFDRVQSRRVGGGVLRGPIATHFLPPGTPGFKDAGGMRGRALDFLAAPAGNLAVARRYLRRAGYANGRIRGPALVLVGARGGSTQAAAEVAASQLSKVGLRVDLRLVAPQAVSGLCGTPARRVAVCSGLDWVRDFNDPEVILRPLFEGASIKPSGNSNWSQLRVPRIDAAMRRASGIVDPAARARAWGRIDRMVTAQAPGVPLVWDTFPYIWSKDVEPVINLGHAGFDFAYTSLK